MEPFDKQLSLAVDAAHDKLDRLAYERSLWALLLRWWWRRQLRQLERRIPR